MMKTDLNKKGVSMKRYIIVLLVGMLFLPSCSLYKKYESDATVDERVMGDVVDSQDTTSIGDINWRDIFTDQLLQNLIDDALANNTDMRTTQLTIEQAQNSLKAAKWGYVPTFAFAPQATFTNIAGNNSNSVLIPVTASWQLNIFGQTRSQIRKAKSQVAYYQDYRQAMQVSLAANVANIYYMLVMLDHELELAEYFEGLYEESYNSTEALYNAGIYKSPAVYQMEASLEEIRTEIVDLRNTIASTEAMLCLLLAEPPHHIERAKFGEFQMPEQIHIGLPARLLDARPDVRMAERNMEIAYYNTQMARQSFYPNITISGLVGYTGTVDALDFIGQAVGQLTQPIFQGGQLRAQVRNAKKEQEKANLEFVQTLYNAGSEVYQYLKDCQTAEEKAEHIEIRVNALQEAYSATKELMNNGSTTYLEVLTAQESLLSAEFTMVQNQFEMILALINLYSSLGGFGTK